MDAVPFNFNAGTVDKTFEFAIEARKATVRSEKPIPLTEIRDAREAGGFISRTLVPRHWINSSGTPRRLLCA
jgi:hypothetical protein